MKSKRATSATPADAIKKTQLLSHLLYWITHDYILPLIGVCFTNKANFYITETGLHKYKLFFFRHKIWTRINSPLFQDIMQNMYEQVEESVVKQAQTGYNVLGVASMRLLPKQNGARPIVNLSKKQLLRPNYKNSVNGLLKNVFHILAMEKRKSDLFGSAAIGKNDIYNMLKAYKQRMIPQMATAKTKFYFCKVDIQGCFNTIDQKILMDLLEKLVGEMEYAVHRFSTVQLNQGNARKKYNRVAISTDDYFQLEQLIETYVQEMRNTVFVDSTSNPYEQRASIFKLLQQHVYQHTIKVGRKYYKQKIGIPQGSVLSTLLCSLYYGYLEQTELANVTNDRNSLLIRYIDDFLFISTDKNRVKKFATMMHQGFPQFGVQVTSNKSLVNFNFSIGGESIQNVKDNELLNIGGSVLFPWCGLLIDIAHLDVLHDFTRITETDIKNSLTVEMNIHPGLALLVKTKQFLKNLAHPIYLDRSFARDEIIMRNIYQSFLFCALKFGATVDMAFKHLNPKFLLSVVKEAIAFQLELLRTRVANTKPVCSTRMVSFLGYHAFATILQKKHNKYGNVIKKIRQEMSTYPKPISVLAQSICQPEFHVYLLDIRF